MNCSYWQFWVLFASYCVVAVICVLQNRQIKKLQGLLASRANR